MRATVHLKNKMFWTYKYTNCNFSVDGWSNVHNKPKLCAYITKNLLNCDNKKGEICLVDTNNTQSDYASGNSKTVEYIFKMLWKTVL